MPVRHLALVGALAALLSSCGLNSIRTRTLLTMVNTSSPSTPRFEPVRKEVADFVRVNLPDAYWSPACPNALMEPTQAAAPLARAVACASSGAPRYAVTRTPDSSPVTGTIRAAIRGPSRACARAKPSRSGGASSAVRPRRRMTTRSAIARMRGR